MDFSLVKPASDHLREHHGRRAALLRPGVDRVAVLCGGVLHRPGEGWLGEGWKIPEKGQEMSSWTPGYNIELYM